MHKEKASICIKIFNKYSLLTFLFLFLIACQTEKVHNPTSTTQVFAQQPQQSSTEQVTPKKEKGNTISEPTPLPQQKTPPPIDNSPFLTKTDRFGVYLGESIESLEWKSRQKGRWLNKTKWTFKDKDHPGEICSVIGAINGNDAIQETAIYIYKGRVYQVQVYFKESSLNNYKILSNSLKEKYGKDESSFSDTLETISRFSTIDEGHKIQIILDRDLGFGENDKLSLQYVHDTIQDQVMKEYNNRKASKVEKDL